MFVEGGGGYKSMSLLWLRGGRSHNYVGGGKLILNLSRGCFYVKG